MAGCETLASGLGPSRSSVPGSRRFIRRQWIHCIIHTIALVCFVKGFLLTRTHLANRAVLDPASTQAAPFDRLVILVIDALRYDMVVVDGTYDCPPDTPHCHQGQMPFLTSLAEAAQVRVGG